jgi:hypothetical protein
VLLQNDESDKLDALAKNSYSNVRWDFSQQFLKLAKQTSQQILKNIEEKLENVYAESHVEYIYTEKKHLKVEAVAFSILTVYQSGLKMTRKNFLKRQINTRE